MPIYYKIYPNYLTDPVSYYAKPVPVYTLGARELGIATVIHNPGFDPNQVRSIGEYMMNSIIPAILSGSRYEFDNFLSVFPVIKMTLSHPDQLINAQAFDTDMIASGALKQVINENAVLVELPYTEKAPQIDQETDVNTGVQDFVANQMPMRIVGKDLRISSGSEAATVIRDVNGTEYKQENLSLNNPSQVIAIPSFPLATGPAGYNSVEMSLIIKTTYTEGGSLRSGEYVRKIRTLNQITPGEQEAFLTGLQTGNVVRITGFTVAEGTEIFVVCYKDELDDLYAYSLYQGYWGSEVEITGIGEYELNVYPEDSVTIDVLDYSALDSNVDDYLGFFTEPLLLESEV